jgi:hypothetical protein
MTTLATMDVSPIEAFDWKTGQRGGIKVRFLKVPHAFTVDSCMSQRVTFAPTVFEEGKRKLTLELTEAQAALFEKLEAGLREHADASVTWSSPLKHTDYGYRLSCKMPAELQYYDGAKASCSEPVDWRGIQCNAYLRISTLWAQRATQGFSVDLVALQYEAGEVAAIANPFV